MKRRKKKQKMVRAREKKKEDKYDGKEREETIQNITQVGRKISIQKKKGEREVCLLFWLKIYSIIGNFN